MMSSRCCIPYVRKSERASSGHRTGKRSIFIPIPRKGSTKECANHWTVALISHASKVMLKILHARLQHYVNQELPDVQAGFRKGRGTRDQIANIRWIIEKARESQRNVYLCFIGYAMCVLVAQLCPTLCDPMDYSPPGSSVHWDFPDKNTGVGCHFLFYVWTITNCGTNS